MEFKGFIFDRLWNVKYRTVRAYFSGIIFFYEHCGPSKIKFWDAYPKVKKYLVDLGRRFDEIPQGSASLNWDQMQKLFKYILSDFQHDLIDTQMFFDVCIISLKRLPSKKLCIFRKRQSKLSSLFRQGLFCKCIKVLCQIEMK